MLPKYGDLTELEVLTNISCPDIAGIIVEYNDWKPVFDRCLKEITRITKDMLIDRLSKWASEINDPDLVMKHVEEDIWKIRNGWWWGFDEWEEGLMMKIDGLPRGWLYVVESLDNCIRFGFDFDCNEDDELGECTQSIVFTPDQIRILAKKRNAIAREFNIGFWPN